ncbi:hypothetical protein Snas_4416 [Stackebrandtia nassauensis DSM 44728]|uniref:Uncharacterized protein n=1 Tax=Stackebrandtia nassauensis (strain DSM 44728 / CIP 108903 / NRRL B-16338 / NBRC 102104 / LLR-40K-21) TaxID=446470 RepID=D3Q513_STANL|nr:hypothetical protein Snas_4416 [Stackebrandtia nassauensis DSM 44728]
MTETSGLFWTRASLTASKLFGSPWSFNHSPATTQERQRKPQSYVYSLWP